MPLRIAIAAIVAAFYGAYVWKAVALHRQGLAVDQLGRGKTGAVRIVEVALKVLVAVTVVLQVLSLFVAEPVGWGLLGWLGVAFAAAGLVLFVAAQRSLGLGWRAGVPDKGSAGPLVTSGAFALSRNPAFLGFLLFFAGVLTVLPTWWLAVASALSAAAIYLQVRVVEEPYLRRELGGPYVAYCAGTGRWLGRGHGLVRVGWRVFGVLVGLVAVAMIALSVYSCDYYRANAAAEAALASTPDVTVSREHGAIVFAPKEPRAGIVFYPGAKVAPEAYAPLMRALADKGMLCVVEPMPLNMAVLGINEADGVQAEFPQVHRWYLMGHSLGGAMAASYLAAHPGQWQGIVLLGAYAPADLRATGASALVLYGSDDGVLNQGKLAECAPNLPDDSRTIVIDGGNHAQFAGYGPQAGDGTPTISMEQQVNEAADAIASFVG